MATAIFVHDHVYYTNAAVQDARRAIEAGESLNVWWFGTAGTRYREEAWFDEESVWLIRTESDDG